MKTKKQIHPAIWLTGGAAVLSATGAKAALVKVDIGISEFAYNSGVKSFSSGNLSFTYSIFRLDPSLRGLRRTSGIAVNSRRVVSDRRAFNTYLFSEFTLARAGNRLGGLDDNLAGLSFFNLTLSDGGSVDGWFAVSNFARISDPWAIVGDFRPLNINYFIFDNESLTLPSLAPTIGGLNAGNYATVSSVTAVPEPSSLMLLAAGAGGVMLRRKNRKRKA